jgi:hypothetical protein
VEAQENTNIRKTRREKNLPNFKFTILLIRINRGETGTADFSGICFQNSGFWKFVINSGLNSNSRQKIQPLFLIVGGAGRPAQQRPFSGSLRLPVGKIINIPFSPFP